MDTEAGHPRSTRRRQRRNRTLTPMSILMAGFVMTACGLGGPFGGSVDSKASGRSDASTRPAARIVSEHLPPDLVDQ
ncbi:MAG: hypothetical protein OES24_17030, partial [Acidimicrobiia bacterium]|nr:hypothetical protein [Acidimicrobiia bacterium]